MCKIIFLGYINKNRNHVYMSQGKYKIISNPFHHTDVHVLDCTLTRRNVLPFFFCIKIFFNTMCPHFRSFSITKQIHTKTALLLFTLACIHWNCMCCSNLEVWTLTKWIIKVNGRLRKFINKTTTFWWWGVTLQWKIKVQSCSKYKRVTCQ